jgi:hypothetical protein
MFSLFSKILYGILQKKSVQKAGAARLYDHRVTRFDALS